uniref:Cellular communication network factor 1, like 2 n=1 Tax=Mola mola TaxID=94237 RepID=A0A3Q3WH84_MOLML
YLTPASANVGPSTDITTSAASSTPSVPSTSEEPRDGTASCPAVCKCPTEPLLCPPGVSTVPDGCRCCKVCAAQLNQDCSPMRPCDLHKGLECDYAKVKRVFSAKSEGRTCEYNGRIHQTGESFCAGCKHQCTCIDGAVGCAPIYKNKLPPASPSCLYPQLVRIHRQCCFSMDCREGIWRLPHNVLTPQIWRPMCPVQTTDWSHCSRSCGMGISSRITNKNSQCKLERETRICTIRPCHDLTSSNKSQKGKKCSKAQKAPEPIHLSYGECMSVRLYRPNFCGVCTDGRCCLPRRTRTIPVTFVCPDGEHFQRSAMFIQSCKCSVDCGHLNEVAFPPQYWMYGDTHKFTD